MLLNFDFAHKKCRATRVEYGSAEPITLQDIMNNTVMFCPSPPIHGPLNDQEDSCALKCILHCNDSAEMGGGLGVNACVGGVEGENNMISNSLVPSHLDF